MCGSMMATASPDFTGAVSETAQNKLLGHEEGL